VAGRGRTAVEAQLDSCIVIESVFAGLLIVAVLAFGIAGIYVLSRLAGVPERRLAAETGVSGPVGDGLASDRAANGRPGWGGPVSGGVRAGRNGGGATSTARTESTTGGRAGVGRTLQAPRLPYGPDTGGRV
jgi:hypothetical protein